MRAIIAGAGPAGFACAKWLNDRGYDVVLVEKRSVPGGKVSAWRDADGDWVESGLHVFGTPYAPLVSQFEQNFTAMWDLDRNLLAPLRAKSRFRELMTSAGVSPPVPAPSAVARR